MTITTFAARPRFTLQHYRDQAVLSIVPDNKDERENIVIGMEPHDVALLRDACNAYIEDHKLD